MRRPGGEADKVGNRYEVRWTVNCILDILEEKADYIHLEPPGPDGDGAEFHLVKAGITEHHQVKLGASWTLRSLARKDVLFHIKQKLKDPSTRYVFVSDGKAEDLSDLVSRAKETQDINTYLRHTLGSELHEQYAILCNLSGNWSQEEAYEALKRVDIEQWPEKALKLRVEDRLALLLDADPKTSYNALATLVQDSVDEQKVLVAHDIWLYLKKFEIGPNQWHKDKSKVALVDDLTNRYTERLRNQVICSKIIDRSETDDLVAKIKEHESKRAFVVTGNAGTGKSGVLLQAVDMLRSEGWPVLAYRLDTLTPIDTPLNMGHQLGLPRSPAQVLAAISHKRDALLVIDQLDAVSLTYGRNTQSWDCVYEVITQALDYENIRVLLACRHFDLENDHRLRSLVSKSGIAEPFPIGPLGKELVCKVIGEVGLDPTKLNTRQLALLAVPLHLKLLVNSLDDNNENSLAFNSEADLYDRFWDYKRKTVHNRLASSKWIETIDSLTEYMNKHQSTIMPKDQLDEFAADVEAMASEHVLVIDGDNVSFFHDGFFDYAFARRFSVRENNLQELLLSGEQHLFRRSQVRQILLYQRSHHFTHYIENLERLLTSSQIRFHIKSVVFDLLADLLDPAKEEWEILSQLLTDKSNPEVVGVWRVLQGNVHWFNLLDSLNVWHLWLSGSDEELINKTIWLLYTLHRKAADQVAELLEPYVGASEEWRNRFDYIFNIGHLSAGRHFFELFLRLVDEGLLDSFVTSRGRDFWHLIYHLPDEKPEWACEAIRHYFERRLKLCQEEGCSNPFSDKQGTSQIDDRLLAACSEKSPHEMIDQVLPFVIKLVELNAIREAEPPWSDNIWRHHSRFHHYDVEEHLLDAVEAALKSIAQSDNERFDKYKQAIKDTPYRTLDFLLMQAYSANPHLYADELIDYLCDKPTRFETDYSYGESVTTDFLKLTTPHCSDEQFKRLETVLLSYYPDWEKRPGNGYYWSSSQHTLLEGCDYTRLSEAAKRRLNELRRKYPHPEKWRELVGPIMGVVHSPISETSAEKMTDAQWLKAMKHYNGEREDWTRNGKLIGGVHELSHVLRKQASQDPIRFSNLALRMPDEIHHYYFDSILMGITDTSSDMEIVLTVCRRCHSLPGRPCGQSISWLISKRKDEQFPDEILDIVGWYVTNDPDPVEDRWPKEKEDLRDAIVSERINTVRGSAAGAIAKIIFDEPGRVPYLMPTLKQVIHDPSTSVRACVAHALLPILNYNRDIAVDLFLEMCADAEDALLGTAYAEHFLNYAVYTHLGHLNTLLDRMLASECSNTSVSGGKIACIAALVTDEGRPYLERCLSSNLNVRKGAATILSMAMNQDEHRQLCIEKLSILYNDSDPEVFTTAANCFGSINADEIGLYDVLIRSLTKSPAFEYGAFHLIDKLHKSSARLSDLTCEVCECYLKMAGTEIADITSERALHTDRIVELIIRTYSQTKSAPIQKRCLNMLDCILMNGVRDEMKYLEMYDR